MNRTAFFTREWPGDALDYLTANDVDVDVWPDFERPPTGAVRDRLAAGVGAIVTTVEDPIRAELVDAATDLRIVAQAGVGIDNIDVSAFSDAGIWVTNTPGVLDDATADLAFALMCSLARRIPEADQYVRAGKWSCWHPSLFLGMELQGATVGIVGMGRIGLAFARRCTGFGMRILYAARNPKPEAEAIGAERTDLDDLLAQSDIVSLHVPLTGETSRMMNRERFERMRTDAILVNTARGGVVDQDALREALEAGSIAGAAIDVTDPEPIPADDPLLSAPNLVIAPHVGSAGTQTRKRMAMMAAEEIVSVFDGRNPTHVVGRGVL